MFAPVGGCVYYFVVLQRLTLSFNEIRESGANAIAYAVVDKPSLEKLDLDGRSMFAGSHSKVDSCNE